VGDAFKDTVVAYPGQVTRVRAQFNTPGQFVWHCHIVEHEDNEMMRPYRIGPVQPGQPDQP
jgi:FtsP/CotA-like multicopper oxidase with cupredoxin domain